MCRPGPHRYCYLLKFQEVISCLEKPGHLQKYIEQLKKAGEHSNAFLNLKNSMESLEIEKYLKTPKCIGQKNIMQTIFQYSDSKDCFENFRIVCKDWKNFVETAKFNKYFDSDILKLIDKCDGHLPLVYEKNLKLFKKLWFAFDSIPLEWQCYQYTNVLLENIGRLNEIQIYCDGEIWEKECGHEILKHCSETVEKMWLNDVFIPNVPFPKMNELIYSNTENLMLDSFQNIVQNMQNLELMMFSIHGNISDVEARELCHYIGQNYERNCMYFQSNCLRPDISNLLPLTIFINVGNLEHYIENAKYNYKIEYLHFEKIEGWDRYEKIFDQCVELKGIAFGFDPYTRTNLVKKNEPIWKQRLAYFASRNIEILHENEIRSNELQLKCAKRTGLKLRFHISEY